MWIDSGEVELACEQENHRSDGLEVSIALCPEFGRLEKAIEGLQEAVGLPRSCPRNDAIEMFPDHAGHHASWLRPWNAARSCTIAAASSPPR